VSELELELDLFERWRPIPGHDGYEASDKGRVRSLDRVVVRRSGRPMPVLGRILKSAPNRSGYPVVRLGGGNHKKVHRLVLEAFVGACPPGMEGCHWDDDKLNNRLSNLRWDTRSANNHDRVRNGRHPHTYARARARKTHCKYGHELTEENTYRYSNGVRMCKACARERYRLHGRRRDTPQRQPKKAA
jgi:hypothetical protein